MQTRKRESALQKMSNAGLQYVLPGEAKARIILRMANKKLLKLSPHLDITIRAI